MRERSRAVISECCSQSPRFPGFSLTYFRGTRCSPRRRRFLGSPALPCEDPTIKSSWDCGSRRRGWPRPTAFCPWPPRPQLARHQLSFWGSRRLPSSTPRPVFTVISAVASRYGSLDADNDPGGADHPAGAAAVISLFGEPFSWQGAHRNTTSYKEDSI